MTHGCERRIDGPTATKPIRTRSAFNEERNQKKAQRCGQQPERNIVHAREGHIRRANHQRHEPVAESADDGRHHHEEHHDEAVTRHEHIVGLRIGEILKARLLELETHRDGEEATDQTRDDRENQIHRADVFVIGRHDPTLPTRRVAMVGIMRSRCVCHSFVPKDH